MPKKIIIRNEKLKERAIEVIRRLPIDPVHEIVIKGFKEIRSLSQNALYWKWLSIIGLDLGMTKDELHLEYKSQFCLPIMIREKDDYPEISTIIESIQAVRDKGENDIAESLYRQVIGLLTTTKLKTKHMSEYMTDIKNSASSLGISLPRPEDQDLLEW